MKIAIDISQTIYKGTGVARYTHELIKALISLKEIHELLLFGFALRGWPELKKQIYSLPRESVREKLFFLPPTLLTIIWNQLHTFPVDLLIGKVDLLHTSDWLEPPAKIPKVTTIHDLIILKYPEFFPHSLVANHKNKLRWVVKESAKIITDSQSSKKDILSFLKVPENKIEVIYPGVSSQFRPQDEKTINKVKEKYHLAGSYLLAVSKLEPRKNTRPLITAFTSLIKETKLTLVIVGTKGWNQESAIVNHPQIKLLGYVDDYDLPALYSGSDCFIYPSSYEGFGFPVLEALSCGATVVTTKTASIPEIAADLVTYADPRSPANLISAIKKGLQTRKSKSELETQLAWTKKFTWELTAQKTLNVYREVLNI